MFALAIIFGIYSYIILLLGVIGLLYPAIIFIFNVSFILLVIYRFRKELIRYSSMLKRRELHLDRASKAIVGLLLILGGVNFIGVLGPELGFDALWYHLTIPKIFLQEHQIFHIPGGLFYYSDMPKLGEMFYLSALSMGNEILAKFLHFLFGIFSTLAIYFIGKKFFDKKWALLACLIFYSNLVAGWQSTTAYIDLFRTFFEIMAFWAFVEWYENKDKKMFIESAILIGLAISTKLISLGSLIIFALLIYYVLSRQKKGFFIIAKKVITYVVCTLLVASPWFFISFLNTNNPIYPLLTSYYPTNLSTDLFNPLNLLESLFNLFLKAADPISPIYLIVIPLFIIYIKFAGSREKLLFLYSLAALMIWYITPQTGGGRFIMPYLPVFSVLSVYLILQKRELTKFFFLIILIVSFSSIGYRFFANAKFIPVIFGFEKKEDFMTKNLNFSYGDFYDIDGFFRENIKKNDTILLYGFHNLYYANFHFIDSSFVKNGDKFNYIAVQNAQLPQRFSSWDLIYVNSTTNVKVYTQGGSAWHY